MTKPIYIGYDPAKPGSDETVYYNPKTNKKIRLPNIKKPCKDCPFRKDSLKGWLGKERMTEILNTDSFVCHKDTSKQCAGHMLIKGKDNAFVKLANEINIALKLKGKNLVFNTVNDCINHHT